MQTDSACAVDLHWLASYLILRLHLTLRRISLAGKQDLYSIL